MPPAPRDAEILLTPEGERRLADLVQRTRDAGGDLTPLQVRVLLDELVESGDGWALGADGGGRVRALLRAAGADLLPGEPGGDAGMPRIAPGRVAEVVQAARGGRGVVAGAVARAVGAGHAWEGLLGFLDRAGDEGVVAIPWPDDAVGDDAPARASAASPPA